MATRRSSISVSLVSDSGPRSLSGLTPSEPHEVADRPDGRSYRGLLEREEMPRVSSLAKGSQWSVRRRVLSLRRLRERSSRYRAGGVAVGSEPRSRLLAARWPRGTIPAESRCCLRFAVRRGHRLQFRIESACRSRRGRGPARKRPSHPPRLDPGNSRARERWTAPQAGTNCCTPDGATPLRSPQPRQRPASASEPGHAWRSARSRKRFPTSLHRQNYSLRFNPFWA